MQEILDSEQILWAKENYKLVYISITKEKVKHEIDRLEKIQVPRTRKNYIEEYLRNMWRFLMNL